MTRVTLGFCSIFLVGAVLARPSLALTDPSPIGCVASSSMALQKLGITPRSLAAIDASDEQAEIIAAIALAQCESGVVDVATLQTQEASLNEEVHTLSDRVSRGVSTSAERTRLPLAQGELAQVCTNLDSQLDTLESLVIGVLTTEQRTTLANINAATNVDVPMEYKVESHNEAQWMQIRNRVRTSQDHPSTAVSSARSLIAERSGRLVEIWLGVWGG